MHVYNTRENIVNTMCGEAVSADARGSLEAPEGVSTAAGCEGRAAFAKRCNFSFSRGGGDFFEPLTSRSRRWKNRRQQRLNGKGQFCNRRENCPQRREGQFYIYNRRENSPSSGEKASESPPARGRRPAAPQRAPLAPAIPARAGMAGNPVFLITPATERLATSP